MATPQEANRTAPWYCQALGLRPEATTAEVTAALDRMSRQANALSLTAPDRARLIRDQVRAIKQDLLARRGPGAPQPPVAQAPAQAAQPPGQAAGARPAGLVARLSQFLQAGWACANCGYGALPTDKFCPKCGNRLHMAGAGPEPAGQRGTAAAGCPRCGRSLAPENAFCIWCGAQRT